MTEHMNMGDVSRRLGINVTAELLESIGIEPVGRDKRAVFFAEEDWPMICAKLAAYIKNRVDEPRHPRPEKAPKPAKKTAAPAPAPYIDPDL